MSIHSHWNWTITIRINGKRRVIPGSVDAPRNATKDTILANGLIDELAREFGTRNFTIEDFSATRVR